MAFFPSLKQNFIAFHSSSRPDCIFEIHQLWQTGFSRVCSNCYCSCSFEPGIVKIGQSSHNMYSNNILNFQEYTTILNACTKKKKSGILLKAPCITNNSIKHQPFVYVQLNSQIVFISYNSIEHESFVCTQFKCQAVLFNPWIGPYQVLPLQAKVDLSPRMMKG